MPTVDLRRLCRHENSILRRMPYRPDEIMLQHNRAFPGDAAAIHYTERRPRSASYRPTVEICIPKRQYGGSRQSELRRVEEES